MIKYDIERARLAVKYLVDATYYPQHLKKIRKYVDKPRALPFEGEMEVLNELLVIGRQDAKAFENLIELVDFKRSSKESYMTAYMRAKRARDRIAVKVEELALGRKMTVDERHALLLKRHEEWNKRRDEALAQLEREYMKDCNELPPYETQQNIRREFWAAIDKELAVLLDKARKFAQHTPKRPVAVQPILRRAPKNTIMADKLSVAIDQKHKK